MSESTYAFRTLRATRREATPTVRPWELSTLYPAVPVSAPRESEPAPLGEEPEPFLDISTYIEPVSLLEEARAEAELVRRVAEQERSTLHEQAHQEGLAEGRAQAQAERTALLEPLQRLLTELPSAWESFCLAQEPALTTLCAAVVERLLQEQLTLEPERVVTIVRAALQRVAHSQTLTVYVHPDDLPLLREAGLGEGAGTQTLHWESDAQLKRGGCRIEGQHGAVDATWESAIPRLTETLRGDSDHV